MVVRQNTHDDEGLYPIPSEFADSLLVSSNAVQAWMNAKHTTRRFMVDPDTHVDPDSGPSEYQYASCVSPTDAVRALEIADQHEIGTIYDLGAGDLRFALLADRCGFDVIAYEVLAEVMDPVVDEVGLGDVELRTWDYTDDWDDIVTQQDAMTCTFGKNNAHPSRTAGITVTGYSRERTTVYNQREVIAEWGEDPPQ